MPPAGGAGVREEKTEYGFLDVANVAEVEKLIRDTIIERKPGRVEERPPADAEKEALRRAHRKRCVPVLLGEVPLRGRAGGRGNPSTKRRGPATRARSSRPERRPREPEGEILKRLTDDERATWVGRPVPRLVLIRSLSTAAMLMGMSAVMAFFVLRSSLRDWWVFLFLGGVFLCGVVS